MLPPECQVCLAFEVDRQDCCESFAPSLHFADTITSFVRRRYSDPSTEVDSEHFRFLNDDVRYELRALCEDTTTWSVAYRLQNTPHEGRMPRGLTRVAQTSAFVHIRNLDDFLRGRGGSDEYRPAHFRVPPGQSDVLGHWMPSVNANVFHLNKMRPQPRQGRSNGRVELLPTGVQHEIETLTDAIWATWRSFAGHPRMVPYRLLTRHIDADARWHARAVRRRLQETLGVGSAKVAWHPPLLHEVRRC